MKIGKLPYEKNDQRTQTSFLATYGGLSIYDFDFEKRYYIDDEDIHFVKGYGYDLLGNPDNLDGTSTDHEYVLVHDDLFDRILETDQNSDIVLKVINKDVSLPSINDNGTYLRSKMSNRYEYVSPLIQ